MGWNLLDTLFIAYALGGAATLFWVLVFEGNELLDDCAKEVGSHPLPPHAVKFAVALTMTVIYVGVWLAWPYVALSELGESTKRGWARLRRR